jgi:glucokinase
MVLVAGDIGGSKTELGIFSTEAGTHAPLAQARFPSAGYPRLQAIVKQFLAQENQPIDRARFAVAGPVIGGHVKATNLLWLIEETSLAQELNLGSNSVRLINDLEAVALAVPNLRPSDVTTINAGEAVPHGAIAVIAPGTGLGETPHNAWADAD